MKYLGEYGDTGRAVALTDEIRRATTRTRTLLEVCGGQAHALLRPGAERRLPEGVELAHGPGCGVSVTTTETIDGARALAARAGVTVCASGDLLRLPGSRGTLADLKGRPGTDVRVVYSALDALTLARKQPGREVVFLLAGFETTAPTAAAAVLEAERLGLTNFSMLGTLARIAPALDAILSSPGNRAQGALVPAHLASVLGTREFEALVARHRVPLVLTGNGPLDLLDGILRAVRQLERGAYELENLSPRAALPEGNPRARLAVEATFVSADASWRGLGRVAGSVLTLRERFRAFDASARCPEAVSPSPAHLTCLGGEVLTGRLKPTGCPSFGLGCTPESPLGAPMVSAEGTCAAYYRAGSRPPAGVPRNALPTPILP